MQTIPLPFVALIAAVERLTETHRKLEGLMHSAGPRDRQTQVAAQDLADGVRAVCHEMAAIKAKQAAFDA